MWNDDCTRLPIQIRGTGRTGKSLSGSSLTLVIHGESCATLVQPCEWLRQEQHRSSSGPGSIPLCPHTISHCMSHHVSHHSSHQDQQRVSGGPDEVQRMISALSLAVWGANILWPPHLQTWHFESICKRYRMWNPSSSTLLPACVTAICCEFLSHEEPKPRSWQSSWGGLCLVTKISTWCFLSKQCGLTKQDVQEHLVPFLRKTYRDLQNKTCPVCLGYWWPEFHWAPSPLISPWILWDSIEFQVSPALYRSLRLHKIDQKWSVEARPATNRNSGCNQSFAYPLVEIQLIQKHRSLFRQGFYPFDARVWPTLAFNLWHFGAWPQKKRNGIWERVVKEFRWVYLLSLRYR